MIIGIDPGKSGAVVMMTNDGCVKMALPIPYVGNEIDVADMATWIRHHMPSGITTRAVLEKVGAMPGNGVCAMFTFGRGVGEIRGMLKTMGIPFSEPTPQAWKKTVLAGTDWKGRKDASCEYVMRQYPEVDLKPGKCRKPHDGIADAVCIAEYGRITR